MEKGFCHGYTPIKFAYPPSQGVAEVENKAATARYEFGNCKTTVPRTTQLYKQLLAAVGSSESLACYCFSAITNS